MNITGFDPRRDLIVVGAQIWGRRGHKTLSMAVDTGSASTIIMPETVDEIGYGPRDAIAITRMRSAVAAEHGYTLQVARFAALGFEFEDFEVNVFDMPTGFGIDGLIGLSLLRTFDYEIRSIVGTISARPATPDVLPA